MYRDMNRGPVAQISTLDSWCLVDGCTALARRKYRHVLTNRVMYRPNQDKWRVSL